MTDFREILESLDVSNTVGRTREVKTEISCLNLCKMMFNPPDSTLLFFFLQMLRKSKSRQSRVSDVLMS